jgi:hypothetical protein
MAWLAVGSSALKGKSNLLTEKSTFGYAHCCGGVAEGWKCSGTLTLT